jgi:hypothetical protein
MAYKRIVNMEITEIIRRYFDSQSLSSISVQSGLSRNTIRKYINEIIRRGITSYDKERIESILPEIIPRISGRPAAKKFILEPEKNILSLPLIFNL